MGTSNHNAGKGELCDGLASHPGGSRNSHFMLQKPELSTDLDGPPGSYADFTWPLLRCGR